MGELIRFPERAPKKNQQDTVPSTMYESLMSQLGEGFSADTKEGIKKLLEELEDQLAGKEGIGNELPRSGQGRHALRERIEEQWWEGMTSGDKQKREDAANKLINMFGPIRASKILERLQISANIAKKNQRAGFPINLLNITRDD